MASNFQNSDILPQRRLWGITFESIIETFQKLIVSEQFGKNENTAFAY